MGQTWVRVHQERLVVASRLVQERLVVVWQVAMLVRERLEMWQVARLMQQVQLGVWRVARVVQERLVVWRVARLVDAAA